VGQWVSEAVKARAELVTAQHEFQRQRDLYKGHATSKREMEEAESNWRKAKAELERAEQKTRLLGAGQVDRVTQEFILRSPLAGEVIERRANPGMELQGEYSGGESTKLFTIGDAGRLLVLGDIYEIDQPFVHAGDKVAVRFGVLRQKTFDGVVDWVSDVLDPETHTSKVRCIVDNPEHLLKPGMYATVEVRMPGAKMIAVPREAVLRVNDEAAVFVRTGEQTTDGRVVFQRRKVFVRLDSNTPLIPVYSGLSEGETIAVQHSILLLGMLKP
jgi:cobalt-zinc-cadmium efflux system membrane fusion protein